MKKILSIVLVAAMMFSVVAVSVSAVDVDTLTAGERALLIMQRADVNGDKAYSTEDVSVILKAAAGIIEIENEEYYDLDLDGYVSVKDAQLMLEVVAGVGSLVSEEETLEAFNTLINGIKSKKPGFERNMTLVCPSIKVTTTGAPISALNMTNAEYSTYVNTFIKTMNSFPYNTILTEEMKAELEVMKQTAVDAYKPQTETKTVAAASNSHYTYFPVNNLGWSSKLTIADIKSITYSVEGGCMVYTITMNDYSYIGDQYPTGTKGFSDRQKLPYGKIFNIPALQEDSSTTVNSVKLQKGKIVLKADLVTGAVVSVDYSYTYISDITSVTVSEEDNTTMTMRTVTTNNVSESFEMNH